MIWTLLALGAVALFVIIVALAAWAMSLLDRADDEERDR